MADNSSRLPFGGLNPQRFEGGLRHYHRVKSGQPGAAADPSKRADRRLRSRLRAIGLILGTLTLVGIISGLVVALSV